MSPFKESDKEIAEAVLNPQELVAKSDSELFQLRRYYELKLEESKTRDLFRKQKMWIFAHWKFVGSFFLAGVVILLASFYLAIKLNPLFGIPTGIVITLLMLFAMIIDDTPSDSYRKNIRMLNLVIRSRTELRENKSLNKNAISGKALAICNMLRELKEANFSVLLKKVKEQGVSITDKTLRSYLAQDLKDVVEARKAPYSSTSRRQKEATVYSLKSVK